MKVLVCGGRHYANNDMVFAILDAIHAKTPITCIIEGGATGADWLASCWSRARGLEDHARFVANWTKFGPAAGPKRNKQMLEEGNPDLMIAFPGGKGTADMIARAKKAGVKVVIIT